MTTFLPYLLFIVGLLLLIKGGDWFVDGAVGIAHKFNMPELLVGATVVSIGTTLPEVMVSAGGALKGSSAIAYGNAIGSIICNTALIAAITITFKPSKVQKRSLITPVIFFFIAAAFYVGISYTTGYFSRLTGILLLAMFFTYMTIAIRQAIKESKADTGAKDTEANDKSSDASDITAKDSETLDKGAAKKKLIEKIPEVPRFILLLIIGAAVIAVGADLLVDNGTLIATALGVPETVIALTFVALGTSLPELVTAITSLIKGSGSLSLGNIIGANMFNMVLVSGTAITLNPFEIPVGKTIGNINASLLIDIPVMLFVMLLLTVPTLIRGKLSRWQGILLLAVYASFCAFQFVF